jgi:hypothetical protein
MVAVMALGFLALVWIVVIYGSVYFNARVT